MANTLRYTFKVVGTDSTAITFNDIDHAKDLIDFSEIDFTGLSPVYSLEDSDTMLVITIPFADSTAGRTAQDAFHNNMKDTWTLTATEDGSSGGVGKIVADLIQTDNAFVVTSIKDGEVDLNS